MTSFVFNFKPPCDRTQEDEEVHRPEGGLLNYGQISSQIPPEAPRPAADGMDAVDYFPYKEHSFSLEHLPGPPVISAASSASDTEEGEPCVQAPKDRVEGMQTCILNLVSSCSQFSPCLFFENVNLGVLREGRIGLGLVEVPLQESRPNSRC